jgi:urease accessory protein
MDLAPHVNARLDTMEDDTKMVRGGKPYVFTDTLRRKGLSEVVRFIEAAGGLF